MSATQATLIQAVRDYAVRHYERNGWDIVVECWSDADIAACIGKSTSANGAIRKVSQATSALADYRSEIQATAF